MPSALGVATLLLVLVCTAGASAAQRSRDAAFHSIALGGTLHFEVYLPADYSTSGLRYPVVYFLHGLPAGAAGYRGVGFVENALDRLDREAILVAPQGARSGDTDPEYLDRGYRVHVRNGHIESRRGAGHVEIRALRGAPSVTVRVRPA